MQMPPNTASAIPKSATASTDSLKYPCSNSELWKFEPDLNFKVTGLEQILASDQDGSSKFTLPTAPLEISNFARIFVHNQH